MFSSFSTFQSIIDSSAGSFTSVIVSKNQIGLFKFTNGNFSGNNGNITLTNGTPSGTNGTYNGNTTDMNQNYGTSISGIDLKTPFYISVPNLTYNTNVGCTICFKARLTKALAYTAEFIGKNNTALCFGNGSFYCSINTNNASMTLWIGSSGGNRSVTIAPVGGVWTNIVIMFGVNISGTTYTLDNSTCSILSDYTSSNSSFTNFQATTNQINRTGLTLTNNSTMTLNDQSFASAPTSANSSGTSLFGLADIKLYNKALTWTELQSVYNEV